MPIDFDSAFTAPLVDTLNSVDYINTIPPAAPPPAVPTTAEELAYNNAADVVMYNAVRRAYVSGNLNSRNMVDRIEQYYESRGYTAQIARLMADRDVGRILNSTTRPEEVRRAERTNFGGADFNPLSFVSTLV